MNITLRNTPDIHNADTISMNTGVQLHALPTPIVPHAAEMATRYWPTAAPRLPMPSIMPGEI